MRAYKFMHVNYIIFEKLVGCKVFCALHSKNIIICLTNMYRVLAHTYFRMNDSRRRLYCAQMQNSVLLSLVNSHDQYGFSFRFSPF